MANFRPINSGSINQYALSKFVNRRIFIFDVSCNQRHTVRQEFDMPYTGVSVIRSFNINYSLIGSIGNKLELIATYDLNEKTPAKQIWDIPYISNTVRSEFNFNYRLVSTLDNKMVVDVDYVLAENNPLPTTGRMLTQIVYDVRDEAQTLVANEVTYMYFDPYYEYDELVGVGQIQDVAFRTQILSADISMSEGDTYWTCNLSISSDVAFSQIKRHDYFEIVVGTDVFGFIVDSRKQSRDGKAGAKLTIRGVSPTAVLGNPRSPILINKVYRSAITAREAIQGILNDATGYDPILRPEDGQYPMQYDILNWSIPTGQLAFTDVSPIDAIIYIAEAVGGVVETSKAGVLHIRPRYPFRMNQISSYTPDHTITFSEVLTISDLEDTRELFNSSRIMNKEVNIQDQMEYRQDPDNSGVGYIKLWLSPRRRNVLLNSSRSRMGISFVGDFKATVTDKNVEIIDFKATLSRPIYQKYQVPGATKYNRSVDGFHSYTFEEGATEVTFTEPDTGLYADPYLNRQSDLERGYYAGTNNPPSKHLRNSLVDITYYSRFLVYKLVALREDDYSPPEKVATIVAPAQILLEDIQCITLSDAERKEYGDMGDYADPFGEPVLVTEDDLSLPDGLDTHEPVRSSAKDKEGINVWL